MTTQLDTTLVFGRKMPDRVYHGTTPYLIPTIQHAGFWPRQGGYVHFAATEGLAWSYGVQLAAQLTAMDLDNTLRSPGLPPGLSDPTEREIVESVRKALDQHGTRLCAVAVIDTKGLDVEKDPNEMGMRVAWEDQARVAPCWRSRMPVCGAHILEWHLYPIPELHDPAVVATMCNHARNLRAEHPRGHPVLEDLPPIALPGIDNVRVFTARVLERHTAPESMWHGLVHSAQVAALALDHADEGAHLGIRLAFALLHDSRRANDGKDPGHGARAARLAQKLSEAGVLTFDERELWLLKTALIEHDRPAGERAKRHPHPDPSLVACWDADFRALERFRRRIEPHDWARVVWRYLSAHIPGFSRDMNEADLVAKGHMKAIAASRGR